MSFRSGWLILITAAIAVALGVLFFSSASVPSTVTDAQAGRTATYNAGSFTFSAPVQMTRPLSQAFYQQGGEPEIKTDIFGNIYLTAIQGVPGGVDLWKSINKGTSFTYLGQPDGAQDKCPSIPQCAGLGGGDDQIDVSPGGYLYVSSLWLGDVTMSTSYDGGTGGVEPGQAWTVHPAAAGPGSPVDDRQWIAAYGPQTVYMTYASDGLTIPPGVVGLFFVKSTDGGKTFSPPTEVTPVTPLNAVDVEGNLVVDPYNGNLYTAYVPNPGSNLIKLASSTDAGATWRITNAYTGPAGNDNRAVFPILAVDRGGNLHMTFSSCTASRSCHVYLTSSTNPGAATPTWLPAVQVDSGINTAVEPWIVAGSPGVVDITWLGSTAASPDVVSDWHVFFAQTRNALSTTPTFEQNQAEEAVMHDKSICFNGGGCAGAGSPGSDLGNRDLLEYYTMTLDPDGNANIAYADSVNNCPADTCITNAWFTKQTGGQSGYAPPAAPAPATFSANITLPSSNGDAEPGISVDSHGCIYADSPGDPDTWYSEDNGQTFQNTIPGVLPTGGGDETIVTIPKPDGSRDDNVYVADLALADVSIRKSTDRGHTWFSPGTGGTAGEMDASSDRQWIAGDRVNSNANQVLYEMDHEFVSEAIRFSASVDDAPWSPPASGITEPEMILPPNSTFPNTNPGPIFVDKASHMVYGFFTAATIKTNRDQPPFGKMPNVWEAVGAGSTTAGAPPGPFVNHPVFKGVFDSPTNPAPPAGTQTYGTSTSNDFPSAAIDKAGNIYAVWAMNNARTNQYAIWFASSHDHGQTFYGPFQVSAGSGSAEMPWIAGGDNGRVAIVYYQSNDPGDPNSTNLHWNTMFAQSLNAKDREPVFTVSQVSDHIMHFGTICNQGILCGSGTRNLLDFFKVAISTDGMAHIAYADTGNANGPSHITYAKQVSGPSVLTNPVIPSCLEPTANHAPYDFDGDGKSDISIFRGDEGLWAALPSSNQNGPDIEQHWGSTSLGDRIVPADYDGDGKADFAVFRNGTWYIHPNAGGSDVSVEWGFSTDIPVPADYDGDGKADLAVFRPSDGYWYVLRSSDNSLLAAQWGASTDKPVAGDYNGDGKADFAVARPNDPNPGGMTWYISFNGVAGSFVATQWGASTDRIVPGDFDGDRKADLTVFRPSEGIWYTLKSTGGYTGQQWGASTDVLAAADYDGDGKTDLGVFRPSEGVWYILGSTSGFTATPFGLSSDIPVPSAYNR